MNAMWEVFMQLISPIIHLEASGNTVDDDTKQFGSQNEDSVYI